MARRFGGALVGVLAAVLCGRPALGSEVAVVVHPTNPVANLAAADLLRIFRAEQQHWRADGRIYLVLLASGTTEKNVVLRRLYRMRDSDLRQFWLGKLYRGEIAAPPTVARSSLAAMRIVGQAPNAISVVAAGSVDASVKVLRIDGFLPGEPGYLLAGP